MKRLGIILLSLIALLGTAGGASAQSPGRAWVVTSCGTPPQTYNANEVQPLTMDVTGKLCSSGTGGGGGAVTIADGADVTLGAKADAVCGTPTGACSLEALTKFIANAVNSAIPAGTAIIGKVGIDQTTPGTTNGVQLTGTVPLPTGAATAGCAGATEANTVVTPINITASTQIITGTAAQKLRICAINLVVSLADNVAIVEGTGSVCATGTAGLFGGTTAATGWNLAANSGVVQGNGQGVISRVATTADNICIFVSSGAQVSGSITTASF